MTAPDVAPTPWDSPRGAVFATGARWVLAIAFICMGLIKALHPVEFLKLVRQYEILAQPLALNFVAATVPWFEVFCGVLLLAGVAVRGTALALLVLLLSFTGAVWLRAVAIRDATAIPFCAIKFDCGCGTGEVLVCRKLAENALLILLAASLVAWPGRRFSLRPSLFGTGRRPL